MYVCMYYTTLSQPVYIVMMCMCVYVCVHVCVCTCMCVLHEGLQCTILPYPCDNCFVCSSGPGKTWTLSMLWVPLMYPYDKFIAS